MEQRGTGGSVLADAFKRRITQLGISRRELTRRTGLSRQTLHNIEHEDKTELKPSTYQALDRALYWYPGTTYALSQGDESVLDHADTMLHADKESAYRWRIVERIQRMPLEELEKMVSMMEREALGDNGSEPMDTETVIDRVERAVLERIESRMNLGTNGPTTKSVAS